MTLCPAATMVRRSDNGELITLDKATPGAIWDATWYPDAWKAADGHAYIVRLPNGYDWRIDSIAYNCTRRGEKHQCWVRHGTPPDLHVDKDGDTCNAGAGSILSMQGHPEEWRGFLHHGHLVSC